MSTPVHGVLVLDKPKGPTSFDMVARVRRAASERRVGHAGTLDPMATGVLLMCLGEGTKLVPYLMDADKEYRATLLLGVATDTDDAEGGKVLFRGTPEAMGAVCESAIRERLAAMVGKVAQRPPRYSALKIDGERLHERARAGLDDEAAVEEQLRSKERMVEIHEIRVEEVKLPEVTIFVRCGKGTYIRSIARDLGEQLSVGGHLVALRRLRVGRFTTEAATSLVSEEGQGRTRDRFEGTPRIFSLAESLAHLPGVRLPAELAARVRNGQKAALSELQGRFEPLPDEGRSAVALDEGGGLVAVVTVEGGRLVIGRGFVEAGAG